MAKELRTYLQQLLVRVDGLYGIYITDRDGVPVLKVTNGTMPKLATSPNFLSTFGLASDQGSKLGLGKNKTIICMYSKYQVIQMNKLPLVINFLAADSCNTGHILSLEEYIDPILDDLRSAVSES